MVSRSWCASVSVRRREECIAATIVLLFAEAREQRAVQKGAGARGMAHVGLVCLTVATLRALLERKYDQSYSDDPCTQMNDWMSIKSRGCRSARSSRITRAKSMSSVYVSQFG